MNNNFYHLYDQGSVIKIVDASTGMQAGTISPRGKVMSPFQVSGDSVAFTVKQADGTDMGTVHKLPSGQLINTFRA